MNDFNTKFNQLILPKYGNIRNPDYDNFLIEENSTKNLTSIEEFRENLYQEIFTIDPEKCTDADDAFSITEINNKLFLIIHIADPTHFIDLNSYLWYDIQKRILTHYPSLAVNAGISA